jgi:hypothetical protein
MSNISQNESYQEQHQKELLHDSIDKTMELGQRFKESISTTLNQIEIGYKGAMWMYWLAFLTGILMIITAIVFAFVKEKNLMSIVFGSLGTLDLLVFFVMKPPLELQNSRIGLARLDAAFMTWFIDLSNLNGILLNLPSTYMSAQQSPDGKIITYYKPQDFEEAYKKSIEISKLSMENAEKTLDMMGKIIREESITNKPISK